MQTCSREDTGLFLADESTRTRQKSANRNGALTDRKIGPAISRRLYKVFMESDAGSTDV